MDTLIWILVQTVPDKQITIDCSVKAIDKEHYWSFVTDIITLLSYEKTCEHIISNRKDLLEKWFYIISLTMDMNPNIKQHGNHIEIESQVWKNAFSMELTFSRSYAPIFNSFYSKIQKYPENQTILKLSFIRDRIRMIILRLADIFDFFRMKTTFKSQGLPRNKEIITADYDISKRPVSMHIPLHRLLAGFLQQAASVDSLERLISKESLPKHFLECLIEHPMRIQALCAHCDAKLWVRNGNSILHQVFVYRKRGSFYDSGFDYDILLLQALCILLGPDAFLSIGVRKFQLQKIFLYSSGSSHFEKFNNNSSKFNDFNEQNQQHQQMNFSFDENFEINNSSCLDPIVISSFLKFIINIITHRTKCGMDIDDCIRREIIHGLAHSDLTFSALQSSVSPRISSHENFEKILQEVANYKSASVFTEGCYTLKAESWSLYDPFFPHHTPREHQQAQDRYIQHLKSTNLIHEKGLLPPPILYRSFNSFGKTILLLWCPSMLYIYYNVLMQHDDTNLYNESSLYAILHLLTMAVEYAPILPSSSGTNSSGNNSPFSSDSFDENLSDSTRLPGGSLLSQIIQLYLSDTIEKTLQINIKQILQKISDRNKDNQQIIQSRIHVNNNNNQSNDNDQSKKELAKKHQQEVMSKFMNAQKDFLLNSAELEFDEDDDFEEKNLITGQSYDCCLCRDSSSLKQSIDDNRPFGLVAFIQKSNLSKCIRKREHLSNSSPNPIDLLHVNINDKNPNDFIETKNFKYYFKYETKNEDQDKDIIMNDDEDESKEEKESSSTLTDPDIEMKNQINQSDQMDLCDNQDATNELDCDDFRFAFSEHFENEVLRDIEYHSSNDVRFCGHYIHMDCLYRYFASLCERYQNFRAREGPNIINLPNGEFLCPTCRRLCNCVIPLTSEDENLKSIRSNTPTQKNIKENEITENFNEIPIFLELKNWKIPEELLKIENLLHKSIEKEPSKYTLLSRDDDVNNQILPSSPVPPFLNHVNNRWSECVDIILQRLCTLHGNFDFLKDNYWCGSKIEGIYSYQIYHFFELIRERLSSLELRSRSIQYSFLDFLTTNGSEMQANQLLFNICLAYRKNHENVMNYRKFVTKILLENLTDKNYDKNHFFNIDILSCDPFAILISIICSNSLDSFNFYYLSKIIGVLLLLNLFQSFLTIYFNNNNQHQDQHNDNNISFDEILNCFVSIYNDDLSNKKFEKKLRKSSIKFLKQASILMILIDNRITTHIPLGLSLDRDSSQFDKDFEQLCCLLSLPSSTISILFYAFQSKSFLSRWFHIRMDRRSKFDFNLQLQNNNNNNNNDNVDDTLKSLELLHPLGIKRIFISKPFHFIKLPKLFQEIFQHLVRQHCNVCEKATPETGICLTCGKVICAGTKHLQLRNLPHFSVCFFFIFVFVFILFIFFAEFS